MKTKNHINLIFAHVQSDEGFLVSLVQVVGDLKKQKNITSVLFARFQSPIGDVYFDQRLGAAHFKRWSKYAFSTFCVLKVIFMIFRD